MHAAESNKVTLHVAQVAATPPDSSEHLFVFELAVQQMQQRAMWATRRHQRLAPKSPQRKNSEACNVSSWAPPEDGAQGVTASWLSSQTKRHQRLAAKLVPL